VSLDNYDADSRGVGLSFIDVFNERIIILEHWLKTQDNPPQPKPTLLDVMEGEQRSSLSNLRTVPSLAGGTDEKGGGKCLH
jgi:hypothetical protein